MSHQLKTIICIFLVIFIISQILQYIHYYQTKGDDRLIVATVLIDHHHRSCFYLAQLKKPPGLIRFYYQLNRRYSLSNLSTKIGVVIDHCQQYQLGTILEATSTHQSITASNDLSLKTWKDTVILSTRTNWVSFFVRLRAKLAQYLLAMLGSPEGEVVFSLMFGGRRMLSSSVQHNLDVLGLNHLLAVSGLHLSILAGIFWYSLSKTALPRRLQLVLFTGVVMFYVALNLFQPSVMRSSLMILSFFWLRFGWLSHYRSWWSLLLAFLFLVSLNPEVLASISFQFSFLATAFLVIFARYQSHRYQGWLSLEAVESWLFQTPIAESWLTRLRLHFATSMKLSFVVNLGLFPLVVFYFHSFSLWSVVATSLFIWFVTPILILGLGLLILAPLSLAGQVGWVITMSFSLVLRQLVDLMLWLMAQISRWDSLYLTNLNFSLAAVVVYYSLILILVLYTNQHQKYATY